jgi:deoxycytidine triphosphate deaminase
MSAEIASANSPENKFYPSCEEMIRRFAVHPARDEILLYLQMAGAPQEVLFQWPDARRGTLTDIGILRHLIADNIVIHRFHHGLLQPNGYDVRLGRQYYLHKNPERGGPLSIAYPDGEQGVPLYNPLVFVNVEAAWSGPLEPLRAGDIPKAFGASFTFAQAQEFMDSLRGLRVDDEVIIVLPGATILGHTEEFIGGCNVIATRISGRSTVGRNMIEVCSDANLGSTGFISRWALEVTNKSHESGVILLVGEPFATIQFIQVEPPLISYQGSYQHGNTIEEVVAKWTPDMMLPRWNRKKLD